MRVRLARWLRAGPRRTVWLVATAALVLFGIAHTPGAAPVGVLRVGVPQLPTSLDPAEATTPAQLLATRLVYEGLVAFGERGDVEPALATTWGVSRDGLVWTFRLRPDVRL